MSTPYERLAARQPPGFRQRPKASHVWWCIDCQLGCESLNGHQGHDLTRIGPKGEKDGTQTDSLDG
jgi:hypothetical protein